MERIFMTGYDADSMPDDTITDGLKFSTDKPFFLICNKPLTGKMYFEFTIDSYYPIKSFHNIPIYAGVSKEPSFGVLNADFCIGSLFYKDGEDYDIESKYNATMENYHGSPNSIEWRIPGATDVIGVGVDINANEITYFVNGHVFYSYRVPTFNMRDEGNLYFCLWGNTYYKQIQSDYTYRSGNDVLEESKKIEGWCNFGKNQLEYLPLGYTSIYGMYFRRTEVDTDIDCDCEVEYMDIGSTSAYVDGQIGVEALIGEDRSLYLVSNNDNVEVNNLDYRIYNNDVNDYVMYGGTVYVNLPIPVERKIYLEMHARSATLKNEDILGIPISLGISRTLYSISKLSFRMNLFHEVNHRYNYLEVNNLTQSVYEVHDVESTAVPEQGNLIGVCLDLANNEITIYVDMVKFVTITAPHSNWSDMANVAYFFIHDEGLFNDSINGDVNLGETPFDMTIPEGYTSLWSYYNDLPRTFQFCDIDCDCIVENDNYVEGWIYGDIYVTHVDVPKTETGDYVTSSINAFMGTYNTVTDEEPHVLTADRDITYINNLIARNNDGYYPDVHDRTMSVDYTDDGTIKYYTVNISQTSNQTIYVNYRGVQYTSSFIVEEGSHITVQVIADYGYVAGSPSVKEADVNANIAIYASTASLAQFIVQITQTPNQTITVYCNGNTYTDSFYAALGSTYRATIEAVEGYTAGTLNSTSGVVNNNTSIYASSASINRFVVTFEQPEHQKVEVLCDGIVYTSSFTAKYGSNITINVVDVELGYVKNENFNRFYKITSNTTLIIPDANTDVCTVEIAGSFSGTVLVNGVEGRLFSFKRGDRVTVEVRPDSDVFVQSIDLKEED